jgi:hypothetical protein
MEALIKEYYKKYSELDEKVAKEWKFASKEADEMVDELAANLKEDFAFAEKVETAWKKYEKGNFKSKTKKSFLKELEKW